PRRRLHAAQRGGDFCQGPRHHPGHGAQRAFPGACLGRRAADVPDDGGRRHGPRRRRLGGADVCKGHRHQAAGREVRGQKMPRFAANLSMMFTDVPFLDRFEAAAKAGFTAVEFLFPYEHPAEEVGKRLKGNGLTQALFNLPPGDWNGGERGFAALPERFDDLKKGLQTALPYAQATGVKRVHLMAGIANRTDRKAVEAYYKSVATTAEFFAPHGLDVVIEPINTRNVPGYFLND